MLSAVSAIAAQNIGAGKDERATKTLKYAIMISMSFELCVAVLMQFISNFVVRGSLQSIPWLFTWGSQYIRSYIWDCMIAGIHLVLAGIFAHMESREFLFFIMYYRLY